MTFAVLIQLTAPSSGGEFCCRTFKDNQVRLQLFALAYNLGNFLRRLALPTSVKQWSQGRRRRNVKGKSGKGAFLGSQQGLVTKCCFVTRVAKPANTGKNRRHEWKMASISRVRRGIMLGWPAGIVHASAKWERSDQ